MFDDLVVASLTARALPPSHDVALCTTHCLGGLAPVASPSDDEAGIASVSLDRRAFLSLSTSQQGPTAACLHVALASMVSPHAAGQSFTRQHCPVGVVSRWSALSTYTTVPGVRRCCWRTSP